MDAALLTEVTQEMMPSLPMDLALAVRATGGFAAGVLLGLAHFTSLRRNAGLFATGGAARAFGMQALRFVVLAAGLGGLAYFGATALLSGALGLLLARTVVLRRHRKQGEGGP